ncbi:GTP-binding protein [Pseudohalocynthiibacter aestuariivivens]|nr:GTP-binding protein [Pseudohalocynthiibacter aestuariivivens]QIE46685.1 GTP-binding protein [Pseudohalocynthiibacter aestuariivivens]
MQPGSNRSALPDVSSLDLTLDTTIHVSVITGSLGSGKTTLLNELLCNPHFRNTAIIVNEFGDVGLDHHLVQSASEDTILLEGGCLCCAAQGDLARAIRLLAERRERAELPLFENVLIETSGLADPGPILQSFMIDPLRLSRFKFRNLVTVFDSVLGIEAAEIMPEVPRQLAMADLIYLSKTDVASDDQRMKAMDFCAAINGSPISNLNTLAASMFAADTGSQKREHVHIEHQQSDYIAIQANLRRALSDAELRQWLDALTSNLGSDLLRLKGIVRLDTLEQPVRLDVVQHLVQLPRPVEITDASCIGKLVLLVPRKRQTDAKRLVQRLIER